MFVQTLSVLSQFEESVLPKFLSKKKENVGEIYVHRESCSPAHLITGWMRKWGQSFLSLLQLPNFQFNSKGKDQEESPFGALFGFWHQERGNRKSSLQSSATSLASHPSFTPKGRFQKPRKVLQGEFWTSWLKNFLFFLLRNLEKSSNS